MYLSCFPQMLRKANKFISQLLELIIISEKKFKNKSTRFRIFLKLEKLKKLQGHLHLHYTNKMV